MMFARSKLTLDDVRPYLVNAKVKGEHIICACPICESNDSKGHHLYIDTKVTDNVILYCQKQNCNGGDIIREFRRLGARHETQEIVSTERTVIENYDHVYTYPDGTIAYYKRRIKYSNGEKEFRFHYTDETGREIWKKPAECNLLYNLAEMQQASECDIIPTLYIVEGEKCVDALHNVGLLATTSNTGAKEKIPFTETDLAMLNKFPVKIIIPDNDEKGRDYVNAWGDVSVLNITDIWPDAPRKSDIADYIEKGLPIEAITNYKTFSLTQDDISKMSAVELMSKDFMCAIYRINDKFTQAQVLSLVNIRAGELSCKRDVKNCWTNFLKSMASKSTFNGNRQKFDNTAPINALKCGDWIADMQGIRHFVKNTTTDEIDVEYASYIPITPSAILKNIENGTEKVALSFFSDGVWHTINIPRSVVASHTAIVSLADLGVDVNTGTAKLLVKYLADVINENDKSTLPRYSTVSHLGWVDDKFIPYTDEIVTDVGTEFQDTINSVMESGDLETWVDYVKPLRKNIYLRVTLGASFASPLVSKVQALPFVLMLWGQSGTCKTVGMMVSASVWGNPAMSKLLKSLNNTINFTMSMLGVYKHLPFFGDELQTIREKYGGYDDLIYRVTEGVDRGRMTNSIVQKTNSWQNCCLFTGEEPISKAFSGGGAKNRVIEIEVNEKVVEDGHDVSSFVKHNYGCAGRDYIKALQNYDLLAEYRKIYREIENVANSTEKQAMAMSLILLGDKISSECIFHDKPLEVKEIVNLLKSASDVDVATQAYKSMGDVIAEHRANFDGSNVNTMWGVASTNNCVYIIKSVLERELQNLGFDFNAVKSKWAERGYLIKTKQGRYAGHYSRNNVLAYYVLLNFSYHV